MSCPFGHGSSLKQARELERAMNEREQAHTQTQAQEGNGATAAPSTPSVAPTSGSNHSTPHSVPLGKRDFPYALFTGGLRTSLGVENAHPLTVWMREMQARGQLKGIDIEKEIRGLASAGSSSADESQLCQLDKIAAEQANKDWKEKRERPPVHAAPVQLAVTVPERFNHNLFRDVPPAQRYDQEITYWNYIHPEVLTQLQTGRQGKGLNHHEEHLFILVHQVFELWFKQILWELEYVRNCLIGFRDPLLPLEPERNPVARCALRLARADKIMRLATEGYGIMQTMDPSDFLEYRDFLSPSSGFQSVQLRELEILLGLRDEERISCAGRHYREAFMANGEDKTRAFDRRLAEKTLKEGLYVWLDRHPPTKRLNEFMDVYFSVLKTQNTEKSKDFEEELTLLEKMAARTNDPKELSYLKDLQEKARFGRQLARNSSDDVRHFFTDPVLGRARSAILFLFTYPTHPRLRDAAEVVEGFMRFEQAVTLWRHHHARMVEMFIGRRPGTGGSSGVEYIDLTAQQYRIFTDVWRVRSLCVARGKLDFDPDDGICDLQDSMRELSQDAKAVYAQLEADAAEKAKAAAAHKASSANGTDSSSTSIAAGVGPGAETGMHA